MVLFFFYYKNIFKDKIFIDFCMESFFGFGVFDFLVFFFILEIRNFDFLVGMMLIVGGGVRERLMIDISVIEEEVFFLDLLFFELFWMKIFWFLLRWMNKIRFNLNFCIELRRIMEFKKKKVKLFCIVKRIRFILWIYSLIELDE